MDQEATSDTGPISCDNGQHSKKGSEMATNEMPLVPWEHKLCETVATRSFNTVVDILSEPDRTVSQKVLDDCLLDACGIFKEGHQDLVQELLLSGASINASSEDGWTPILIAIKNGDLNLLLFFLHRGADVNAVTAEGDSALTLSIRPNRSLDIIKLLLQLEEIDNNHRNHQGYTALMKAIELRDFEVMKLLIDDHKKCNNRETLAVSEDNLDSDETIINSFGQELYDVARIAGMVKVIKLLLHLKQGDSPLLEAALIPDLELVKILIDSHFCSIQKEDSSYTMFLQKLFQTKKQRNLAVGDVDIPIIKLLLESGAAVNKSEKSWSSTEPPLITAVKSGSLGLVQLMCKYGAKLDVTENDSSKTPLLVAAVSGKADILQFLLSKHAMVAGQDREVTYKYSVLHLSLVNGHTNCAEILLNHGYKIDGPSAAEYAIAYNKPAYLKYLLEKFSPGVQNSLLSNRQKYNTILTKAVTNDYVNIINTLAEGDVHIPDFLLSHAKSASMVQLLVSNGASVNRGAITGKPVLLTLIKTGKDKTSVAQIVKIMLEKGANVNGCNLYGVTPLIAAGQRWDSSELLNTLLLHGADVHKRDNQGVTAFMYAVEKNYTENAKLLIQLAGDQKVDIEWRNTSGSTPLLIAATYNNKTITDLLLDRGADVNVQDQDGDTALTLVARRGDADTLKKIIERGADINHQNKSGCSALMYAAERYSDVNNLDVLLLHGAKVNIKDNNGNTALLHAVQQDRAEITKRLLEHEGNQKVDIDVQDTSCSTALILAVKKRNKAITDLLLAQGANVNIEDNSGDTALTLVVRNGDSDTLKKIIERGADINHRNKGGYTALMLAGRRELYLDRDLHLDLGHLKALLLNAADVNIKDNMGNTALLLALEQRLTETAKFLIEHEGGQKVDLDAQNTSGSTALISAVKQRLKIITDLLIDRGANVNVEDNNGDTALTLVAKDGDTDTLEKIIEGGADVNHQNENGCTALMLAVCTYSGRCHLDVLLLNGANVNIKDNMGNTALLHALNVGFTETARLLIEHEGGQKLDLDAQNTSGSTALILAVKQRHRIITDLLIDRGANVNIEDNNGDTALTLTAKNKDVATVMKLLERGADINHQNREGYSALMIAARNLHKESMEVLLKAGADVNVASHGKDKKTAISLLFETKISYNKSTVYLLIDSLLVRGASSSYLKPDVLFDYIQSNQLRLIPKLLSSGFGPAELSSEKYLHKPEERVAFPVVSPFMCALLYSQPKLARYFDDNWFVSTSDIRLQAKHDTFKDILDLERRNNECMDIFDEFCSQPMSLSKLSFVAVSSAIGCVPGREERVEKLPLPAIIKDMLLFKKQEVQLDIHDWDDDYYYSDYDHDSDNYGFYDSDNYGFYDNDNYGFYDSDD